MRHIAREGRCWVLGNAICMQAKDVPASFPGRDKIYQDPEEWLNPGDSIVVDPTGSIAAGPMHEERGALYATCDPARAHAARRTFDVAGHYHRPDVFRLEVDRSAKVPIRFAEDDS
jgi:nitrilase